MMLYESEVNPMSKKFLKKLPLVKEKQLFLSLLAVTDQVIHKRYKSLHSIRFAKPTKNGWSFFKKKKVDWEILEKIVNRVEKLHKSCCSRDKIAHWFSHVANLSNKDFATLQGML